MTEDSEKESGYDGKGLKGALWTIAGTTIGQLATNSGLLGGIFGRPPAPFPGVVPGERLVSREVLDLTTENSMLKANAHADAMNAAQMVVNATQAAQIACQQRQIDQLFGLTRLVVPNGNLNPGYGPAFVSPGVPPPPPLPDATIQAIAAAVAAQTAKEAA